MMLITLTCCALSKKLEYAYLLMKLLANKFIY